MNFLKGVRCSELGGRSLLLVEEAWSLQCLAPLHWGLCASSETWKWFFGCLRFTSGRELSETAGYLTCINTSLAFPSISQQALICSRDQNQRVSLNMCLNIASFLSTFSRSRSNPGRAACQCTSNSGWGPHFVLEIRGWTNQLNIK